MGCGIWRGVKGDEMSSETGETEIKGRRSEVGSQRSDDKLPLSCIDDFYDLNGFNGFNELTNGFEL